MRQKNKNTSPSAFPGTRGRSPFPSARTGHSGKTKKKKPTRPYLNLTGHPPASTPHAARQQQSPARTRRLCSRSRSLVSTPLPPGGQARPLRRPGPRRRPPGPSDGQAPGAARPPTPGQDLPTPARPRSCQAPDGSPQI